MKIKSLTSLLVSTFLVSSFANAMDDDDLRLSDAINGISTSPQLTESNNNNSSNSSNSSAVHSTRPQRVKNRPPLPEASAESKVVESREQKLTKKFNSKYKNTGIAADQAERFFAPMTRQKGTKELRKVANVVCDFFQEKAEKASTMKAFFEGSQGEGFELSPITASTFNLQAKYGQHIAMVRDIEKTSKEVSDLETQQKAYPTQKAEIEQKIEAETKALQAAQTALEKVEQEETTSKQTVQTAENELNSKTKELEELTEGIETLSTQLGNTTNAQDSVVDEQISNVDSPNIDNLASSLAQQRKRTHLTTTIQECRDNLKEVRESLFEIQERKRTAKEEVEKIKTDIQTLKQEYAEKEERAKAFPTQIEKLKQEKQELQDKADTYALMKYLRLVNIYLALPNDERSYYEKDVALTTLSPDSIPLIRQILDLEAVRSSNVSKNNILGKLPKALDHNLNEVASQYNQELAVIVKQLEPYKTTDGLSKLKNDITNAVHHPIKKGFTKVCKDTIAGISTLDPIDEPTFNEQYAAMLNDLRADKLVKVSMDKWKKKISTGEGSLMQRLGLDSFLFNSEFNLTKSPDIFSFPKLQQEFSNTPGENDKNHPLFNNIWALGVNQIENSLYPYSGDTQLMGRTDPIYNFALAKSQSKSKETKRKKDDENHEATYAALKYFSYANMAFAVRYDMKGEKSHKISTAPLIFKDLLKEPIPDAFRIDNVLAGKAIKWGKKLQEHKEFINTHALTAYTFAPLNVLEKQEKN